MSKIETLDTVYRIISQLFPTSYTDWADRNRPPPPPYAVYFENSPKRTLADNGVYAKSYPVTVEIYIRKNDFVSEETLENSLQENEIIWTKNKAWVHDISLYQVTYILTL